MGPIRYPNDRIGLQWCIDAFPINSEGSKSMKPDCWMNLSLPPAERTDPANMLLSIIIPCSVKDVDQKKYYDFMADYELFDLFHEGATVIMHFALLRVIIVVKLFVFLLIAHRSGRSPSKSFLHFDGYSGTSGADGYTKLCRLSRLSCVLTFLDCRSNTSTKKCVCDGYRRFLAMGSRARQASFEYRGLRYQYG